MYYKKSSETEEIYKFLLAIIAHLCLLTAWKNTKTGKKSDARKFFPMLEILVILNFQNQLKFCDKTFRNFYDTSRGYFEPLVCPDLNIPCFLMLAQALISKLVKIEAEEFAL